MILVRFTKDLENDLRRGYSHFAGFVIDDTPENRKELIRGRRRYDKCGLKLSLREFEGKIGLADRRDILGLSFHKIPDNCSYKSFIVKFRKQIRIEDFEVKIKPKFIKSNFRQIDCLQLREKLFAYVFEGELPIEKETTFEDIIKTESV